MHVTSRAGARLGSLRLTLSGSHLHNIIAPKPSFGRLLSTIKFYNRNPRPIKKRRLKLPLYPPPQVIGMTSQVKILAHIDSRYKKEFIRESGGGEDVAALNRPLPSAESIKNAVAASEVASETAETAVQEPAPPPRVYKLYHWKVHAPNARLVYIRDAQTADHELSQLGDGPLGFDMEWKPAFYKGQKANPVALIQLANDDVILLLQVSAMNGFPQKLKEIMESGKIVKTGVGIQNDCKKLYLDYAVVARNCVDLSLLARTVDNERWKGRYALPIGLARLCEAYEELTLHKGSITRSNWETLLSEPQQHYAANDSHSAYRLYQRLSAMTLTLSPSPSFVYYTFNYVDGRLCDAEGIAWQPVNPNYDPGPPPPPREPKAKNEKNEKEVSRNDEGDTKVASSKYYISHKPRGPRRRPEFPNASNVTVMEAPSSYANMTARGGHRHRSPMNQPPSQEQLWQARRPVVNMTNPHHPWSSPVARQQHEHDRFFPHGAIAGNTSPQQYQRRPRPPEAAPNPSSFSPGPMQFSHQYPSRGRGRGGPVGMQEVPARNMEEMVGWDGHQQQRGRGRRGPAGRQEVSARYMEETVDRDGQQQQRGWGRGGPVGRQEVPARNVEEMFLQDIWKGWGAGMGGSSSSRDAACIREDREGILEVEAGVVENDERQISDENIDNV
ncbi:uncharacterized protein LAESUDRAFT_759455 [Laetiporus sulphureus 93-53]|uniref:3'-5' exonuclease n=1 Tax=Laetiporus sulphureus 93-53 TaxID=1314785 RepID=A0A165E5B6_9APHY|nr:uncharacterized protein LAESUDRAFT_759455 [Laetiporus sulphureus 93-53]KZT06265.1 hypothetical protein LAESUDRAFT_759455 [Laetiporus sulphureus 93-53]